MVGIRRKKIGILELEKRMMFDASLAGLITSTVIGEDVSNATPAVIDGDVTITGTTLDFNGETFRVTSTGLAQDDLSIRNEGTGAGQIGFDGTNVTFGGTQIGTIVSDGQDGADLIIDFDNTTTKAAIERLIENVTYQNTSDNPTATHNLNVSLDGFFNQNVSITIVPQNEAPDVTNNGINLNEGGTQTLDAAALGITDPDNIDSDVVVSVTSAPLRGQLELTTNAGVAISSFTLDDINNNRVVYIHGGSETTTDSFDFTVTDGTATTASDTFDISITPVNDPFTIDINTGTTVFQSFTTSIGGVEGPGQFGTEVFRRSGIGEYANMQAPLDNQSSQISLIFTTPAAASTSTPGQVIFESGGSGVGIGLYLDASNSLAFYISNATSSPRLSSVPLATSTQYAVVIEIDQVTDEVRMSYQQANDFDWFNIERAPETKLTGYTATDHVGSNNSGYGVLGAGSYGGYTGGVSGISTFQGTIDSDLVITRMPTGPSYINTQLVVDDADTLDTNIIYTITADAADGELYLNGVLIGVGDSFTQEQLDQALVTYTHGGAVDPADSFDFDVTDGTTTLSGTYNITVDTNNTAPVITPAQTFDALEDASNGDSIGYLDATDAEILAGQVLTYSITGGTGAGIFAIDSATGQITIADNSTLDYETTTSYTLTFLVRDNGPGLLSDTDTITINVIDVNEAPIINAGGPFNVDENAANNTVIGTVTGSDTGGETLSYSIVGGNTGNAFKINASTGLIQVRDFSQLDFETKNSYTLTIRATDNNVSPLSTDRNFVVTLNDINEAPSFNDRDVIYSIDQNALYSTATGNWYRYYNNNVSITTALANAEAAMLNGAAGHLVTITSGAENTFVDSILGNHIWLAASDIDNEGSWLWIAGPEAGTQFSQGGTPVGGAYERWAGSEPNTTTNDYAIMNTNGQWYDEANGNSRRYVVEWERDDVINNSFYQVSHTATDASDLSNGTSIGFVQAADQDGSNSLVYSIEAGNADGIFTVNASTGEVTILDNTNLDASILDTYVLTIRATEVGGAGLFDEVDITINFSETFAITANNPVTVNEGGNVTITTADLNVNDGDTPSTDIHITVTDTPDNGFLALSSAPTIAINSFTLDDLQNNRVLYVSNGGEVTTDTFDFSVTDGATTVTGQSFDINVTPVNDAPTINVNTGTTVVEGGTRVVTAAMLNSLDPDDADTGLTFTASSYLNGHIEVNGVVQNTFTQDDINNNRVVFIHDGNEGNGRFNVVLADGGEDSAGTASATFTLTKTAVNDAPLITTNTGIDVVEGSTVTITTAHLNVTDPDDSGTGLTYTLSGVVNGQVELSTNPNVPIITFTQADLVANRVVFRHDGNEADARFDISVIDGGENGSTADTATFNINKIDVNDSPTIGTNLGSSVNQNSIVILKKSVLAAADSDDNGTGLTFTITNVNNGQLEFASNPNVAITSFTQDDIDNSRVAFRHSGPLLGTNFDFSIADGGENGAVAATGTFNLTVDNTNDAPIIATNAGQTIDEGATLNITTAMLDSFDPDDFGAGLTWTASNLTNGILQVNGVTQNTFTQADLDAGLVSFIHDGSETLGANFDIQVADGGEDGATPATGNFAMSITPINDAPIITTNTGATMNEGASLTVTSAMLDLTDDDDAATDVTYTASNLSNGAIEVSGVAQNTFTQDDINNNRVVFIHDDSETTSAGFDISLADGGEDSAAADTDSFTITVTPINEAPTITVNTGATIDEAASVTITSSMLDMSDVDDADTDVTYTASNLSNGAIEVSGVAQNTFTQDDINNNRVVFIHDGSETTSAGFDISLADGGENSAAADTDSFAITVTPINEAPTITVNTGVTMNEGASQTITSAMLDMSDVDDADTDVTYTASNLSNGAIEVSGVAQNTFTQDDINNNRVVFIHDGSETTSAGFDISLADGGENSAAADTDSFTITVTPVNDAPNLIISNGNTVGVNFNDYTVSGYWGGQDSGTATISPDGYTLTLNGNPWKKINLPYTITADTILSFDFLATDEGEVQGLGFDVDNDGTAQSAFQFLGDQLSYAPTNKTFNSYNVGDGWVHYDIAVGTFFTGNFNFMTFFADDDASAANDAAFRNLVLFENNAELRVNEGQSVVIDPAKLNVSDNDDSGTGLTFTASNLSNGVLQVNGVTQNTFTQTDLNAGLVTFLHDGSETSSAGFDISVIDGGEDSVVASTGRFDMVVDPINDAPTITVNTGTTVLEGGTKTITSTMLNMADSDDTATDVTYTASNLSHGTIEVNGVAQNTFTQDDINNNRVDFIHDGSEIDGSFDISLADGGENGAAAATASFALSRINVNDAPTDITADATSISELGEIGDVIATLGTSDVDVPSDSFTYTIMSDPDNMFLISGNQLLLNAEADYETATQHSVTIRTDDGNGGTFDKVFTINIEDASELTLNTLPKDRPNTSRDGYLGHKIEEDRDYGSNGLIQSFISGNSADQINAFYGSNGIGQIIRENTTFEMQDMLDSRSDFVVFDSNLTAQTDENTENTEQNTQSTEANTLPQGKTIRDILSALKEMSTENNQKTANNSDSNTQDDTETASYRDLYDEFEDTLTYQERRQSELRRALQAET